MSGNRGPAIPLPSGGSGTSSRPFSIRHFSPSARTAFFPPLWDHRPDGGGEPVAGACAIQGNGPACTKRHAPYMVFGMDKNRPDLKFGLDGPEGPFNPGKGLAGRNRTIGRNPFGRLAGTDGIMLSSLTSSAIFCSLRSHVMELSVMVILKCFPAFFRLASRPTRRPMVSLPCNSPLAASDAIRSSTRSVATGNSSRTRRLSYRRRGLGQTRIRSPGKSGWTGSSTRSGIMSSGMSGVMPLDCPLVSFLRSVVLRALIQSIPAGSRSSSAWAEVIIPRPPARAMFLMPNRFPTWPAMVAGQPSVVQRSPMTSCFFPFFPSRLQPKAARGHLEPSR